MSLADMELKEGPIPDHQRYGGWWLAHHAFGWIMVTSCDGEHINVNTIGSLNVMGDLGSIAINGVRYTGSLHFAKNADGKFALKEGLRDIYLTRADWLRPGSTYSHSEATPAAKSKAMNEFTVWVNEFVRKNPEFLLTARRRGQREKLVSLHEKERKLSDELGTLLAEIETLRETMKADGNDPYAVIAAR